MKGRIIAIVTNFALAAVVVAVSLVGVYSGSTAAVTYEGENLFYGGNTESGEVALTFNVYEGAKVVLDILDELDNYEAKATFFIGGAWADDNVDCVREIYNRGHEVGSHGYFHKDHSKLSLSGNSEEIRPSVKLLEMISGKKVTLFAPPSGAFSENTLSSCEELGLKVIMWSKDTIDWRDKDVKTIISRATKELKSGDIVLMHPKEHTKNALPEILKYIRDNGLKTATVSQLIGE